MASVSVVIPAFNAGRTVAMAIESALSQSSPPAEVIVVDDGSSDDTASQARRFGARITLIRQSNGGPAAARNRGIAVSKAAWIGLLDADDEWLLNKLERQVPYTREDRVGLVYCRRDGFEMTLERLWQKNEIRTSTVLLRREAFLSVGQFDEDRALIGVEDYNLWLRMAAAGWKLAVCPEHLVKYQPTENSLTRQVKAFATAELANVTKLSGRLPGIPQSAGPRKKQSILVEYGRELIYVRDLSGARRMLLSAFRMRPSIAALFWYVVALAPTRMLDAARGRAGESASRG